MAAEGTGFLVLFFSNFERIIKCQPKAVVVEDIFLCKLFRIRVCSLYQKVLHILFILSINH